MLLVAKNLNINSLNTLKNELMKIFRAFRVFEHAMWQKTKTQKYRKSTGSFLNKRTHSVLTVIIPRKLLKSHQFVILAPF